MANSIPPSDEALKKEDALALASALSSDELERMKQAEQLIELRYQRSQRRTRFSAASQALVGYVALAGFFANAYQSCVNKQSQEKHDAIEADRWQREFERSRRADTYHAFFDTSMLATDPSNPDKRLVGYTLLQEFVNDAEYHSKATVTLEESLIQELRADTGAGLSEAHRNAVIAILSSLSHTSDCMALEEAARAIDKIAERHVQTKDVEETSEVFKVFVRRIFGRATLICRSLKELRAVRRPLAETLLRHPEIANLPAKTTIADARARVMELLRDTCVDEVSVVGVSECPTMFERFLKLCAGQEEKQIVEEEKRSCDVAKIAPGQLAEAAAAVAHQADAPADAGTSDSPRP